MSKFKVGDVVEIDEQSRRNKVTQNTTYKQLKKEAKKRDLIITDVNDDYASGIEINCRISTFPSRIKHYSKFKSQITEGYEV